MEIEYDGTHFYGLQVQNRKNKTKRDEPTVQQVMEKALLRLFKQKLRLYYSGRTDRGVHGLAQPVNFKVDTKIPLRNIKNALNSFLPDTVKIKKIKTVSSEFHARFSAVSKTYRYCILNSREQSVFERLYCWHIPQFLDLDQMKRCSDLLTGKHDFSLFAREAARYHHCIRTVNFINIKKRGKYFYIEVNGDGFLRCMVRNMVSFLVRCGRGEFSYELASSVISGTAAYINRPAPARGLFLVKVFYA